MYGWMKYTKLLKMPSTEIWVSMKSTKLVKDEMYDIDWFIAKFENEYSKICVVSIVRA